jgi:hypothetical protein
MAATLVCTTTGEQANPTFWRSLVRSSSSGHMKRAQGIADGWASMIEDVLGRVCRLEMYRRCIGGGRAMVPAYGEERLKEHGCRGQVVYGFFVP